MALTCLWPSPDLSWVIFIILIKGEAGEQFMEQLFRIFDKDGDGSIDFKEFMIATDMTSSGDPEEKLRWAFRMYDKDGSGKVQFNVCLN